jgi:hypothetical protein
MEGLLRLEKGKANMERMEEEVPDSEYRMYQHFLTNSRWGHQGVILKVARDASEVMKSNKKMGGKPTGFIVDESAHLKKGINPWRSPSNMQAWWARLKTVRWVFMPPW